MNERKVKMLLCAESSIVPSLSKSSIKRITEQSIMYKFMKKMHLDYIFPRVASFWDEISRDENKMKELQPKLEYVDLHEFLVRKVKGFLKSEFGIEKDSYSIEDIKINMCPEVLIGHMEIGGKNIEKDLVLFEYLPKGTVIQLDIISNVDLSIVDNSVLKIGMFKKSYGFGKLKIKILED